MSDGKKGTRKVTPDEAAMLGQAISEAMTQMTVNTYSIAEVLAKSSGKTFEEEVDYLMAQIKEMVMLGHNKGVSPLQMALVAPIVEHYVQQRAREEVSKANADAESK